jgi:hypothetical protein
MVRYFRPQRKVFFRVQALLLVAPTVKPFIATGFLAKLTGQEQQEVIRFH